MFLVVEWHITCNFSCSQRRTVSVRDLTLASDSVLSINVCAADSAEIEDK